MKKVITYIFLCSYAVMLLKPLLPFVSDFVGHVFWKYEHIATVHKEHGSYHLHYELEQAAEKNQSNQESTANNREIFSAPHELNSICDFVFGVVSSLNKHFPLSVLYYAGTPGDALFAPPRC